MLQLSLARVLQGLGAAGILSVNTALIRFIYPQIPVPFFRSWGVFAGASRASYPCLSLLAVGLAACGIAKDE
ncbi:hypothetical protein [Herbaspirillum huttiense]|uniref:hypothetical protein n=1 Tax=Herbaspirillum huttiense TaxID=863372 RepID=UPI0018E26E28|nr:hypothetical protein [Herbaspirillum huttiense]